MTFYILLTLAAIVSGGIASVAGFGIGSVLYPMLRTWLQSAPLAYLLGNLLIFAGVQ